MFRPEVLFRSFERVGLADRAVLVEDGAQPWPCGLLVEDAVVLADQHHTAALVLEYQTDAVPRLQPGQLLDITPVGSTTPTRYRVRAHPVRQAGGYYSRVDLDTVR